MMSFSQMEETNNEQISQEFIDQNNKIKPKNKSTEKPRSVICSIKL